MTEKKRIVFVVNPISGTQGKKAILKWIDERIDRSIYDYSIVKTEYAGHASQLAAAAVHDGVDVVVAIGGDGTINEIARSLVHTDTALGIIPCGSGNGLTNGLTGQSMTIRLSRLNMPDMHRSWLRLLYATVWMWWWPSEATVPSTR